MEINYEGKGLCERSRRACPYESVDDCSLAALASLVSPHRRDQNRPWSAEVSAAVSGQRPAARGPAASKASTLLGSDVLLRLLFTTG
eukprot:scaffold8605_cov142-Skeletonema_marinoi.AAC.4